jgi:hypothetical protein
VRARPGPGGRPSCTPPIAIGAREAISKESLALAPFQVLDWRVRGDGVLVLSEPAEQAREYAIHTESSNLVGEHPLRFP